MEKYKNQKDMQMAINGKMIVMAMGLMLLLNAFTATVGYSIAFFQIAYRAGNNDAEILKVLEELQKGTGFFWIAGIASAVTTVMEIFVGIFCLRFSNQLKAAKLTFKFGVMALVGEVMFSILLVVLRLKHPLMIITTAIVPLALMWGASRLHKLYEKYPNRGYAVETAKIRQQQQKAKSAQKSVMQRAKAQVKDEARVSEIIDEISTK